MAVFAVIPRLNDQSLCDATSTDRAATGDGDENQARVVVIGGGIAGCSALYHLTQEGWSDVALLERDELTTDKVGLGYLLNTHGMLMAEATIDNIPAAPDRRNRIWYGSAAAAKYHDMDWLKQAIRAGEDVQIRSLTNEWTTLVLAGPKSRQVLSAVSSQDWSAKAFPWLSVRETVVGDAPAVVMSVILSGELAYEIHTPNAQLAQTFAALKEAGAAHGLRLIGGCIAAEIIAPSPFDPQNSRAKS